MAPELLAAAREMAPLHAAHLEAAYAYQPRPFGGRLLLFRAETVLASAPDAADCGWGPYVRGGVEVHWVPGDHCAVLAGPN